MRKDTIKKIEVRKRLEEAGKKDATQTMYKFLRKHLYDKVVSIVAEADDNDEIVLLEDGVETTNTYHLQNMYEPDAKNPYEWVNSILFVHQMQGSKKVIELKHRKAI